MNYEQMITYGTGQRGREIWMKVASGEYDHNSLLKDMRETQQKLAAYSKHNAFEGLSKQVQQSMLSDIKQYETFAWRIYMFGKPNRLAIYPGMCGEFAKRLRTDMKYHSARDGAMVRLGEWGCEMENNMLLPERHMLVNHVIAKRQCLKPGCRHKAIHAKHKWIKRVIREEWELTILAKYKY